MFGSYTVETHASSQLLMQELSSDANIDIHVRTNRRGVAINEYVLFHTCTHAIMHMYVDAFVSLYAQYVL